MPFLRERRPGITLLPTTRGFIKVAAPQQKGKVLNLRRRELFLFHLCQLSVRVLEETHLDGLSTQQLHVCGPSVPILMCAGRGEGLSSVEAPRQSSPGAARLLSLCFIFGCMCLRLMR